MSTDSPDYYAGPRVKVMFLGGPLDHALREVQATASGRPVENNILATDDEVELGRVVVYELKRCVAGGAADWWVYILGGHAPSMNHILDSMPTRAVDHITQGAAR